VIEYVEKRIIVERLDKCSMWFVTRRHGVDIGRVVRVMSSKVKLRTKRAKDESEKMMVIRRRESEIGSDGGGDSGLAKRDFVQDFVIRGAEVEIHSQAAPRRSNTTRSETPAGLEEDTYFSVDVESPFM